jgi:hypothetical protein
MAISGLLGDIPTNEQPTQPGFTGRLQRIRPATPEIDPGGIVLPPDTPAIRQMEDDASPQWDENMLRVMQLMQRMGVI